jgi:hypothetical protein
MAEILYGPWAQTREALSPSSKRFRNPQQLLLAPLIEARQALMSARRPFKSSGDIRLIHCRQVLSILEDITNHTSIFCQHLQRTDALPTFISSYRYPLLILLHRLQERSSHVTVLIDSLRISTISQTRHTIDKRHDIDKEIEYILSDIQDFQAQLNFLEPEIQFQKRGLSS